MRNVCLVALLVISSSTLAFADDWQLSLYKNNPQNDVLSGVLDRTQPLIVDDTVGGDDTSGGSGAKPSSAKASSKSKGKTPIDPGATVSVDQYAPDFYRGDSREDVELGGIILRGEAFDPNDRQYGTPYLRPIYASQLFKALNNPKLDDYAKNRGLDPAAPATHDLFVSDVNDQLNQLFALDSLAAVLDNDGLMKGQTLTVQDERVEYAMRKILIVDNKLLNEQLFEDFVGKKIEQALKDGPDAVKALSAIGISEDLVELYQQRIPNGKDPKEVLAAARAEFDRASGAGLVELNPAMAARLKDIQTPTNDYFELFARMKAKVGNDPYFFNIDWTEAKSEPVLVGLARTFKESWQAVVISGQNPAYGANDAFPDTFEAFEVYVRSKLVPRQRANVRQKVANTWMFSSWKNLDILNPQQIKGSQHLSDMFKPTSSLRLNITTRELDQAYRQLKFEIAAHDTTDFTIVEVKLGDSKDVSTGALNPCILKFNSAFEKPYTEEQKQNIVALSDHNLTTAGYDKLILKARTQFPVDAYNVGSAALKADPACAAFAASVELKTVRVNPEPGDQPLDEKSRISFIAQVISKEQLQKMMIPKMSRRDSFGNVFHYFFVRHRILYLPRKGDSSTVSAVLRHSIRSELCAAAAQSSGKGCEDKETAADIDRKLDTTIDQAIIKLNADVRDQVVQRRLADRMCEAVEEHVTSKYRIRALYEKFSYGGVDGYQLKAALADPIQHRVGPNDYRPGWIPQMFLVARQQKNPELLQQRRLIEKSSKVFEKSDEM